MQIGLIGGIGPAAQDYYTRLLIAQFAAAKVPLELTTVHADAPTLLANLAANRYAEQAEIFGTLTDRLAVAGAGLVAVTSIAGHFCRQEFARRSSLPVVDMVDAVSTHIRQLGMSRIGILGTRAVMESQFYGGLSDVAVIAPGPSHIDQVHDAYVAMATAGTVTTAQRDVFKTAADRLIEDHGVEAILLGGTDLVLVFSEATSPLPVIDCAAVHAQTIARRVLEVYFGFGVDS
jgi:aspartate racemase